MSYHEAAQKVFYDSLVNNSELMQIANDVYDFVDGKKEYPYITIGESSSLEWDTFYDVGRSLVLTVHCWSDSRGAKEVQQMQGFIYSALHRARLDHEGYNFVLCDSDSDDFFRDEGGLIWHGVQTFRVIIEEI
tara:strand:+ start:6813 stop:7211 length:399 start_codon:yes stop_codon:yes gene_type:complete